MLPFIHLKEENNKNTWGGLLTQRLFFMFSSNPHKQALLPIWWRIDEVRKYRDYGGIFFFFIDSAVIPVFLYGGSIKRLARSRQAG